MSINLSRDDDFKGGFPVFFIVPYHVSHICMIETPVETLLSPPLFITEEETALKVAPVPSHVRRTGRRPKPRPLAGFSRTCF